ncbi:formimidoylglutamate deiminase [Epidermidibacterium keratini]
MIDSEVRSGVLVSAADGIIADIQADQQPPANAQRLAGIVLPGIANCHSHAFHRALRGRTQAERGSFWTWREQMYSVAERLDPDSYYRLARAAYAEMTLAGITAVGEFHYLHHGPGGRPYADPNAMSRALVEASGDAGLRITLLDTCYVAGGIGQPLQGVQARFGDGDADSWATRVDSLGTLPAHARLGAAAHSVRGVPADQLPVLAAWASEHEGPLHAHVSEQVAENEQCIAAYGTTPVGVLDGAGLLGERFSAVHATHLTDTDIQALGASRSVACFCPTTERDLADGIGPARELTHAGSPLSLGSDSHAIVDPFEEARAVELNTRLASQARGHFTAAELLQASTAAGHRSIGWGDAGELRIGARADLVAVDTRSVRMAGFDLRSGLESVVFAASAPDVTDVIIDGVPVVQNHRHLLIDDVPGEIAAAIGDLT